MAGAVDPGRPASSALALRAPAGAAASRWLRVPPPVLALALTLAALALQAWVLPGALPWAQAIAPGVALIAVGLAWSTWAALTLRRAGTPVRPGALATVLVDHGPYRVGRNPMALGTVVAMLGVGLIAGAPLVVAAAAIFVALLGRVHIAHEEARLRRAFGGWYSDYAASVRRWI